jgi:ArsR family transcriptional regulator
VSIQEKFITRAQLLKAMAHPTRLFILDELSRGERCVCEIVNLVGHDFSTISKHLALMKNAGLIEDRKDGPKVFYMLKCQCVNDSLECVERLFKEHKKKQNKEAQP